MRFDGNRGREKNYEPNSFGGPAQTGEPTWAPIEVHGTAGSHAPERHREDDDFVQAGALYRVMSEDAKQRLIANIAGSLARVSRDDIIERAIGYFRKADADYGQRLAKAVASKEAKRADNAAKDPAAAPAHPGLK